MSGVWGPCACRSPRANPPQKPPPESPWRVDLNNYTNLQELLLLASYLLCGFSLLPLPLYLRSALRCRAYISKRPDECCNGDRCQEKRGDS